MWNKIKRNFKIECPPPWNLIINFISLPLSSAILISLSVDNDKGDIADEYEMSNETAISLDK
jgi:hypothetical protein